MEGINSEAMITKHNITVNEIIAAPKISRCKNAALMIYLSA